MPDITPTFDFTGNNSQADRNTQDIQNIMTEMSRLASANGVNRSVNGFDLYYDKTGVARILIGQSPDDGRIGIWVSKPGLNVTTLLGG